MAAAIRIEVTSSGSGDIQKSLKDIGSSAESAGKSFNVFSEMATGAARAAGEAVLNLAGAAISKMTDVIGDSITAARESNMVAAQTAQVIKSTGGAAQVTAQHVLDYASALSAASGKSLFGDEQIAQSTNLLLTFTNIHDKTLDAATAISVDMAQALGGAPKDAAIQLGKALNDPIKGVTALSRVGVSFSKDQVDMITKMQQTGDMAGAQAIILGELNKEFGGSAAAAAAADGGFAQFHDRLGEMEETIGKAILPVLGILVGFLNDSILPAVESASAAFASWLGDPVTQQGIAQIATVIKTDLTAALDYISGTALPALTAAWASIQPSLQTFVSFVTENAQPILAGLATALVAIVVPAFVSWAAAAASAAAATVIALAPVLIPIALIGAAGAALYLAWQSDFGGIRETTAAVWAAIQPVFNTLVAWLQTNIPVAVQALANAWTNVLKPALDAVWQFLNTYILPIFSALVSVNIAVLSKAIELLSAAWSNVLLPALTSAWDYIDKNIMPVFNSLAKFVSDNLSPALNTLGGDVLGGVKDSLGYIGDAAQGVIRWFEKLADSIDAIEIPDWLKGKSPPPLANWLEFIGDSAKGVASVAIPGLISAFQDMQSQLPGFVDMVNGIGSDELAQFSKKWGKEASAQFSDALNGVGDEVRKLGADIGDQIIDTFSGAASLDRAKAKAIDGLKDIGAAQQANVQAQLAAADEVASKMSDPNAAAKYVKTKSDQIFELAKLQSQVDASTDVIRKKQLTDQIALITDAQKNELEALTRKTAATSPVSALLQRLSDVKGDANNVLLKGGGQFALPAELDGNAIMNSLRALTNTLTVMTTNNSSMVNSGNSVFNYIPITHAATPVPVDLDINHRRLVADALSKM